MEKVLKANIRRRDNERHLRPNPNDKSHLSNVKYLAHTNDKKKVLDV